MKKSLPIILLIIVSCFTWYFLRRNKEPIQNNRITIGTNAEYPPFTFVEKDNIVGFDIDIIKEVCKRLNKTIELKDMPFDALIPEIQRGSVHVIAAGMTPTPDRAKEVLFTQCYFTGDPLVIITPKDKPLTTIDQLNGKKVIVNDGYTADFYMTTLQGPILTRLPAPAAAFLALKAGRADAYVAAHSTVKPFFKQYGVENFTITPIPNTEEKYALAVSPRRAKLVPQINEILDTMKKDGTLEQLKKRWQIG